MLIQELSIKNMHLQYLGKLYEFSGGGNRQFVDGRKMQTNTQSSQKPSI